MTRADVTLADHHASAEINGGVAAQAGFVESFGGSDQGEAVAELDELRLQFFRKAALAGQDRVARPLVDAGVGPDELADMTLGAVPPSPDLTRLRERRAALGLAARRRRAAADPRRRVAGHARRRCRCTCGGPGCSGSGSRPTGSTASRCCKTRYAPVSG